LLTCQSQTLSSNFGFSTPSAAHKKLPTPELVLVLRVRPTPTLRRRTTDNVNNDNDYHNNTNDKFTTDNHHTNEHNKDTCSDENNDEKMAFSPSGCHFVAFLVLYVGIPTTPCTASAGHAVPATKRTMTTDDDNNNKR
jgi:hypothetical protein